MRPEKQYEVALMKLIGASEGVKPKYTDQQEAQWGLETYNYLICFIDFPLKITLSAKKSVISQQGFLEFCLLSGVMASETTESKALSEVIDACDRFKAETSNGQYTFVAKYSDSKFLLTIEGSHEEVLKRLGLSLQALEMRTARE